MTASSDYTPGACNIGAAEIRRRRNAGWAGLALLAAGWAAILLTDAPAWWALLLFVPALGAAAGFVQAAYRFCFYFGFASLFNFGELGREARVADRESLMRDRKQAWRVMSVSVLAAAAATLIAYAITAATG
jgi:hypothetical protein